MTSTALSEVGAAGLVLHPVRATSYRADTDRPLDAVTMRPLEVWDDELLRRVASGRPDHVLNLIAPDSEAKAQDGAATLRRWRDHGVVAETERPALYAWSWEVAGSHVQGVAGAVDLPMSGLVIPHEHVRQDIVRERAAQLQQAAVQAEPIVLLHDGDPLLAAVEAREPGPEDGARPPADLVDLTAAGERHRIRPLTDPESIARVVSALGATEPPVVADGHHRLAALDSVVSSGWNRALVLLVDVRRSDLRVGTIHRVVAGLDLATVTATAGAHVQPLGPGSVADYLTSAEPGHLRWVAADLSVVIGLDLPLEAVHALRTADAGGAASCAGVARETCHLHSHLLPSWRVPDSAVSYVHDWDQARAHAGGRGGVALRTCAPALDEVVRGARSGRLLPHKATSIGPKPRIGLLMLPRTAPSS